MPILTRRQFTFGAGAGLSMLGISTGCDPSDPDTDESTDGGAPELDPMVPGPEPETPWEPEGEEDTALFPQGVQTGDALADAILISVQTTATELDVVLAEGQEEGFVEVLRSEKESVVDGFLQMELGDLKPDTTYSVVFYADDTTRSRVGRFRTALYAEASRTIRFGASSCLGGNRPWANLTHISKEKLDFFVFLGDTIYADAYAESEVGNLWKSELSQTGLLDITSSTSMISTWDDHEVDNNWSWSASGINERFDACLENFRRFMPHRSGRSEAGIWRKLSWGQTLDLFVLDCRSERKNGEYISQAQMDWLKTGLSESTARFKVIVNSVPIADFSAQFGDFGAEDRWQGFPAQRTEILSHIEDNSVSGVLWLAGDLHVGGLGKVDPAGSVAENQWEVLAGPAGSAINFAAGFISPNERLPIIMDEHNSTLFEVDPDASTITVSFIGDSGEVVRARVVEYDFG
jgi:alkaline phosphatase D